MEYPTQQAIILMQGPPACGKSTHARKYQESDPEHIVIVSRDAFRHARGKYWVPKQEDYITALEQFAVDQAIEMGYTVIVDATNMNPAMIADMVEIARLHNIPVVGCMVHTTLDECLKRDRNKDREHTVGAVVINNFYKKYIDYCQAHNLDTTLATTDTPFSLHFIYNPENATDNN